MRRRDPRRRVTRPQRNREMTKIVKSQNQQAQMVSGGG